MREEMVSGIEVLIAQPERSFSLRRSPGLCEDVGAQRERRRKNRDKNEKEPEPAPISKAEEEATTYRPF